MTLSIFAEGGLQKDQYTVQLAVTKPVEQNREKN